MRSVVAVTAIALALLGAVACEAKLEGAPCPCIMPAYTCLEPNNVCVPTSEFHDPDAGEGLPDGGVIPDSGFFSDGGLTPDGGPGTPDASDERATW